MEWGVASPTRCDAMQRKDRSMMSPGSGVADLLAPTTTMKRKTKANAAGGRKEGSPPPSGTGLLVLRMATGTCPTGSATRIHIRTRKILPVRLLIPACGTRRVITHTR
jgi:hypothetical protein